MRLTLSTDYALRTLMYVGAKAGGLVTIAEIAGVYAVSKTHLMKVVNRLAQCGYLETVRGRSGGVRLARRPEEIGVGSVVRQTEEELAVMGCLSAGGFCRLEGCCVLQRAFHEATLAFLATLDGYTLADLMVPKAALARSLGLAGDAASPVA